MKETTILRLALSNKREPTEGKSKTGINAEKNRVGTCV